MKSVELPFGKAVEVYWLDSKSLTGWSRVDEPRSAGKIVSLGYVTHCDDECLAISSSIHTDKQSVDDIIIPWGAVIMFKRLEKEWDR